jgi:hypothetical protein
VTVIITDAVGRSEVEVTCQLTALTSAAGHHLREFADGYPACLQSWQDAIATRLQTAHGQAGSGR